LSNIQILDSRDILGKNVTVYCLAGKPLFLAKAVAEWIEHTDVSAMLMNVNEGDKVKLVGRISDPCQSTTGGDNEHTKRWFLTIQGFFDVLMNSQKPIAKAVKSQAQQLLYDLCNNRGDMEQATFESEFVCAVVKMIRSQMASQQSG
jgi:hypothetical protein